LWNRGLTTREDAERFLVPHWVDHQHDPKQFRHMEAAVAKVFAAIEAGDRITVHGDYDADGVTGSTVLLTTLAEIETKLAPGRASCLDSYIPHRDREGYGLQRATVPKLKERGTRLIITVDCGIACVEEIALAKAEAMDTIVVDHHQFGDTLPDGHLIHPGLPEETYPFKKLAAVGVSYKFATVLLDEARRRGLNIVEGWEKWLLDLVAIATVTDMVPLVGENRVLETFGLRVLNKTRRPGLLALLEQANVELGKVDTETVGFAIGPRLNAAGRMDHASLALRLLLAKDPKEARDLADSLERCNRDRQDATKKMVAEAEAQLEEFGWTRGNMPPALLIWNRDWSPSLVGLVAGRFLDRFARPVVVVGSHDGHWIGSGRSIDAYDITQAMKAAGEGILTRCGGHVQACGFALEDALRLTELRSKLVAHATERLKEADLVPELAIDAEVPLSLVTEGFARELDRFQPYGEGNRRPILISRRCVVATADVIGASKNHLRLQLLTEHGRRLKAIGFKMGEKLRDVRQGAAVDISCGVVWHPAAVRGRRADRL
jgi:single-stranded-DNA-specific exonuclease